MEILYIDDNAEDNQQPATTKASSDGRERRWLASFPSRSVDRCATHTDHAGVATHDRASGISFPEIR